MITSRSPAIMAWAWCLKTSCGVQLVVVAIDAPSFARSRAPRSRLEAGLAPVEAPVGPGSRPVTPRARSARAAATLTATRTHGGLHEQHAAEHRCRAAGAGRPGRPDALRSHGAAGGRRRWRQCLRPLA